MSVFALVHIGSASVSGGLVEEKKLVFTAEREYRFQEKLDPTIFLADVTEVLKQVLADLLGAKLGSPVKVVIFLSSPFIAGQLNISRQTSAKPFKITEKVIWDLVSRDTGESRGDKKHAVVDAKIMSFRLNGYPVITPHGQKVTSLEVARYVSIGAAEVLQKFREIVRSACHHDQLEFHSASFALFNVVRGLQPDDQSFLLLDIGGEITELTLVWQGIIRETFSYPLGYNALVRHLVVSTQTIPAAAHSTLDLGLAGGKQLASVQAEWLKYFKDGLVKIIQHRFWSGEIILLAEDLARAPIFVNWLEGAALNQLLFSVRKLEIKSLTPELLRPLINLEPKARPTPPLLVESVFMLK